MNKELIDEYFQTPNQKKIKAETLYHYTSTSSLWQILENDSLLARHSQFSNDKEEMQKVKDLIIGDISKQKEDLENFNTCFCCDGDLLSMWRAYALNGVAIKFDFSTTDEINLKNSAKYIEKLKGIGINDSFAKDFYVYDIWDESSELFLYEVMFPLPVWYNDGNNFTINFDGVNYFYTVDELRQYFENERPHPSSNVNNHWRIVSPFLKNSSFKEEQEYRISVQINSDYFDKKVSFLSHEGLKIPTIELSFKTNESYETCKRIRCPEGFDFLKEIMKNFNAEIIGDKNLKNQIIISPGINQVKIFRELEFQLKEKKDIKIWCQGHLPIREIRVGPSNQKDIIKLSIENFKKQYYWLKYVEIVETKIPFRGYY